MDVKAIVEARGHGRVDAFFEDYKHLQKLQGPVLYDPRCVRYGHWCSHVRYWLYGGRVALFGDPRTGHSIWRISYTIIPSDGTGASEGMEVNAYGTGWLTVPPGQGAAVYLYGAYVGDSFFGWF